eukprot:112833-Lingulodinium_polyedra.AAC.1
MPAWRPPARRGTPQFVSQLRPPRSWRRAPSSYQCAARPRPCAKAALRGPSARSSRSRRRRRQFRGAPSHWQRWGVVQ